MKKIFISGKRLRSEIVSTPPNRKGEYRLWVKSSEFERLFGKDTESVVEHFNHGVGALENHICIFYTNLNNGMREHLERFLESQHSLDSIEKENLGILRTGLSSLLSGDQSDQDATNELLDLSIFEIITYKDHEISGETLRIREQRENERHCLPFQDLESTHHPQLTSFSIKVNSKIKEAKEVGIKQILSTLPPRPSPKHYWNHELQIWGCISYGSYYRFKGVDDPDYD